MAARGLAALKPGKGRFQPGGILGHAVIVLQRDRELTDLSSGLDHRGQPQRFKALVRKTLLDGSSYLGLRGSLDSIILYFM